jgi:hypothetical protein
VLVLNAAACMAFWVWVTGRAGRSWYKVSYTAAPASPSMTCERLPASAAAVD